MRAAVAPFIDVAGVAGSARELVADAAFFEADGARIEAALVNLLSREPTAAVDWLDLARVRFRRGAPASAVHDAILMSSVTAPREAAVMIERATLALLLWEALDGGDRRKAIADLAEVRGRLRARAVERLKAVVAAKSAAIRSDIRDQLAARLNSDRDWLKGLGAVRDARAARRKACGADGSMWSGILK